MTDFEIVVYATHNKGLYDSLINNKFKTPVTVLGWGEKWINYVHKSKVILNYLKTIQDKDKVIIVLDAFDTKIMKHPREAVERFVTSQQYTDKVLFSTDCHPCNYIEEVLFNFDFSSSCKDEKMYINPGMYMGRVKHIIPILEKMVNNEYNEVDDQRWINKKCKLLRDSIEIDKEFIYFENINYVRQSYIKESNAVFVSYPGLGGSQTIYSYEYVDRNIRYLNEHAWFFTKIISLLVYIGVFVALVINYFCFTK